MTQRRFWTTREIKHVAENYHRAPIESIAFHLKRTPKAIRRLASRYKISRWPELSVVDIAIFVNQGYTHAQIAEQTGRHQSTISRMIKRG